MLTSRRCVNVTKMKQTSLAIEKEAETKEAA